MIGRAMSIAKFIVILFIGVSFFAWLGWFVYDDYIGVPYWINKERAISGTGLRLYVFQPIFLNMYDKNGGTFAKVLYVSKNYKVGILELWLAGKSGNGELDPVKWIDVDGAKLVTESSDLKGKVWFGKRIRVDFISGEVFSGVQNSGLDELCTRLSRVCQVLALVKERSEAVLVFTEKGVVSKGFILPVLYLGDQLLK